MKAGTMETGDGVNTVSPARSVVVDGYRFRRRRPRGRDPVEEPVPKACNAVAHSARLQNEESQCDVRGEKRNGSPTTPIRHAELEQPKQRDNKRASMVSASTRLPKDENRKPELQDVQKLKRRRKSRRTPKLYTSIGMEYAQETRFRMLVEAIAREEFEKIATSTECAPETLAALENAVVESIEVARKREGTSKPISTKRHRNQRNEELEDAEKTLQRVAQQYRNELEQWERVRTKLSTDPSQQAQADGGHGKPQTEKDVAKQHKLSLMLPPIPDEDMILGVEGLESVEDGAKRAVENYVLQHDELRHTLKIIEAQHAKARQIVSGAARTLAAHVFEGVPNFDCATVQRSPSVKQ